MKAGFVAKGQPFYHDPAVPLVKACADMPGVARSGVNTFRRSSWSSGGTEPKRIYIFGTSWAMLRVSASWRGSSELSRSPVASRCLQTGGLRLELTPGALWLCRPISTFGTQSNLQGVGLEENMVNASPAVCFLLCHWFVSAVSSVVTSRELGNSSLAVVRLRERRLKTLFIPGIRVVWSPECSLFGVSGLSK